MRVLVVALALLAPAGGRDMGHGLSVALPVWWTPVDRRLSRCTDPVQRFALRGRGAEALSIRDSLRVTRRR